MAEASLYRFGEFELDCGRFELRRRGAPVDVQPKALDLIVQLVRHRTRVLGHDELIANLWPDVAVSEASLSKAVAGARRALGDDARRQAWIQTVRGRGFRFVADVHEIEEATRGGVERSAMLVPGDFVGREDVLAKIDAALVRASAAEDSILLLTGEAGVGKTRTAGEASRRASARGVRVVRGRCPEDEDAPAYWPWMQVVRDLLDPLDGTARSDLLAGLGEGLADLVALLPSLEAAIPVSRGSPRPQDPAQARFRLLDTVSTLLIRAARTHPTLIVLDDLHAADAGSLSLLDFLSRGVDRIGLVLLALFRDDALPVSHPLREVARLPYCVAIPLAGLDAADVARLVEIETGVAASPDAVASLHDATGGNPFFVRQLAQSLATRGALADPDSIGVPPVPASVRPLLLRHLSSLKPSCVDALRVGAVIGRKFELSLLAAATGRRPEELLADLEAARRVSVLQERAGSWAFPHALMREALLETLGADERAHLHRRVGEALETLSVGEPERALSRIAHHLCAGAASGGADRAVARALEAAESAAQRLACEEAVALCERGLAVRDLAPVSGDAPQLPRLLLVLGEAQMALGQRAAAHDALRRAAALARASGAADALARAALAWGGLELSSEVGVHEPELIHLLDEALEALPPDLDVLRVRVLVRQSIAVHWSDDAGRDAQIMEEILRAARDAADPAARAYARYGSRWRLMGPADLPTRLDEAGELLRLAERAGSRELELAGHSCRFLDLLELGRVFEADRELEAYGRLAEQMSVPRYRYRTLLYRGARAVVDGRFTEAEAIALRALELGRRFGGEDVESAAGGVIFTLRREQGRAAEIEPALAKLVAAMPNAGLLWRIALALLHLELERPEEARAAFADAMPDLVANARSDFLRLPTLALAGECAALLGEAPHAEKLLSILHPYAHRALVLGAGVVCWGALDRTLGLLAAAVGDLDAAERHLHDARELELLMGARPWLGWTDLALAEVLERRARRGDAEAARAARARAQAVARDLGLVRLAARTAAAG